MIGGLAALVRAARTSKKAQGELLALLRTNEFEVGEAAGVALPLVLELVASRDTPRREHPLDEIYANTAEVGSRGAEPWVHRNWRPAWEAAKPAMVALLDDDSAGVRQSVLFVLGQGRGDSALVLPALTRLWHAETDPATRLCVVDTAVELAMTGDRAAVEWLRALEVGDDEPEARMLVSAAVRPDPGVIERGLAGRAELFREARSFEMSPDQVRAHVRWVEERLEDVRRDLE
ncbi:hypothetical protein [Lentzea sp. CA-135723]|uniref:hypothetical protein n=1 Tax=Lentzea sp. CA-135723 TaxID=3239950 RepID=UPI003D8D0A2A